MNNWRRWGKDEDIGTNCRFSPVYFSHELVSWVQVTYKSVFKYRIFLFQLHPPHHAIENPFQWVKVEQLKVLASAQRSEMGFDGIFGGGNVKAY